MPALPVTTSRKGYLTAAGTLIVLILLLLGVGHRRSGVLTSAVPRFRSQSRDILDDVANKTLGVRMDQKPSTAEMLTIEQYQKVFVISLPLRSDHRDAISLAAILTGIDFEFVDGVTEVDRHALPPGGAQLSLNDGALGNWRAHMNIAQRIVREGISSALVLEDDADWDLRIKSQMRDFARATRLLLQPIRGSQDTHLDPTYPQPTSGQEPSSFYINSGEEDQVTVPTTSPYGDLDRWDMHWIGHCGVRFPDASDLNTPLGRAVVSDDQTVPETQHIEMQFGNKQLVEQYPNHTRAVSRTRSGACSVAYGISQAGARRFLYELGVHKMTSTTDMMLRTLCDGVDGRHIMTCLSAQPQLFQHHRPVGSKADYSNITPHEDEWNEQAFTRNVRWSTRMNLEKLLNNETDYVDLFPDGEERPQLGWR